MEFMQQTFSDKDDFEIKSQHMKDYDLYSEKKWGFCFAIGAEFSLAAFVVIGTLLFSSGVNVPSLIISVFGSFLLIAVVSAVILRKHYHRRDAHLRSLALLLDPNGSGLSLEQSILAFQQQSLCDAKRLEMQSALLREHYLVQLMKGNLRSVESAYDAGKYFGIDWDNTEMRVMLFALEETAELSGDQLDVIYRNLKQCLLEKSQGHYAVYPAEIDNQIACVLMPLGDESLRKDGGFLEVLMLAKECLRSVEKDSECVFRIGISGVNTGIAGVARAYSQAMDAYLYQQLVGEENEVLFYHDMPVSPEKDEEDAYWFEKERQFLNCVYVGDYANAASIFNKILVNNCISSAPSLQVAKYRMSGLINSLMSALGEIRLSIDEDFFREVDPYHLLMECKSIPELQSCSRRIFEALNAHAGADKKTSVSERIKEIAEYLKENYYNPELSIKMLAEKFQMNPSYLSRAFKKQMGVGLSEYLQKIRVESAKELMWAKDLSIKEISERVGYNNVMTMNRAFKKYEGTTPGRIR